MYIYNHQLPFEFYDIKSSLDRLFLYYYFHSANPYINYKKHTRSDTQIVKMFNK
jgi:hypothetical protein